MVTRKGILITYSGSTLHSIIRTGRRVNHRNEVLLIRIRQRSRRTGYCRLTEGTIAAFNPDLTVSGKGDRQGREIFSGGGQRIRKKRVREPAKKGYGYICHICARRNEFPRQGNYVRRQAWSDKHRRSLTRESNLGIISNAPL